ncbi:Protein NifQ [Frankliniella fusca]|uniref:Protein NifQ n=1 Tax=Frankliniella fusca TaxID=407009 RepID=A0AAE1GWK6_9NEOP|nr:Protein NifQ [Frankliniella fusca]
MPNPQNTHARMHARALLKWRASKSTPEVSWLTSLLHADILSSRFDQQANSPGSWTKLALKPPLLKRIQNASLETCAFNVQDVSGVTLDNNGGAKKNIRNKNNGFQRCILDPLVEQWVV